MVMTTASRNYWRDVTREGAFFQVFDSMLRRLVVERTHDPRGINR